MEFDDGNENGDEDNEVENDELENELMSLDTTDTQEMECQKDGVIFVIDCQDDIFIPLPGQSESQFKTILKTYSNFLKSKIISRDKDKVGLIFFNSRETKNPLNFEGIHIIQSIDTPDPERIQQITTILQNENSFKSIANDMPIHEILWICAHELKILDKKQYKKRLFLFTTKDDPCDSSSSREQAIHQAKQLSELQVNIEFFPLQKADNQPFDVKKFYADIITIDPSGSSDLQFETDQKMSDLAKKIRQKEFAKRMVGAVAFHLAPDVKVGVKFYMTIRKQSKPFSENIHSKTQKNLKSVMKYTCAQTNTTLYPNQIGTFVPLGKEKVVMNKEELNFIKKFDDPGIKLMGFKDRKKLKDYHNYRSSCFLYPNDERISGSSQVFDALIKSMIRLDKYAIARFVMKSSSSVRFIALLPQQESYDSNNFQTPPGLNAIFLPFSDDIRGHENILPQKTTINQKQLDAAKLLIKSLTIDTFDCRHFENPDLQHFYTTLQDMALNEPTKTVIEDLIVPDIEGMKEYESVFENFKKSINYQHQAQASTTQKGKQNLNKASSKPTIKEKGSSSQHEPEEKKTSKTQKNQSASNNEQQLSNSGNGVTNTNKKGGKSKGNLNNDEDEEILEMKQKLREGKGHTYKVDDLKEYLSYYRLNTVGKKDILVERAFNHAIDSQQ